MKPWRRWAEKAPWTCTLGIGKEGDEESLEKRISGRQRGMGKDLEFEMC